ncbi:MAG: transketolase [Patescibacteria group bacterium]
MAKTIKQMELLANQIREDIIKMLLAAGSGHSAGPLGMADVFTALYFGGVANLDPKQRHDQDRDRVVLSNAHICPVLYATLARRGYFPLAELKTLRKLGSRLQGHSNSHFDIGIETSGGPLGQGISQAVGMAIAARANKTRGKTFHTWCLESDGEFDEGQTWEAYMLAGKMNLRELTTIVDRNNIQIDGFTEDVMPLEDFTNKLKAFNWFVIEVDGHNIRAVLDAMRQAKAQAANPTAIVCHTIPGKGVDFMENKFEWHGKPPNRDEARIALHELRTLGGKIKSEHE